MIAPLQRLFARRPATPPVDPMPINRRQSRLLAVGMPWLSTMAGSLAAALLWVPSAPLVPPLGLMLLIAWRLLRPGLLPLWAGLPLGAFDDLYSGQPCGSAILAWSLVLLVLDAIDLRVPWRSVALDWLLAASLIAGVLLLQLGVVDWLTSGGVDAALLLPQWALAAFAFPMVARLVAACDRLRLVAFVPVGG